MQIKFDEVVEHHRRQQFHQPADARYLVITLATAENKRSDGMSLQALPT